MSSSPRALELIPTQIRRLQLQRAEPDTMEWLRTTLDRERRGSTPRVTAPNGVLRAVSCRRP